MMTTGYDCEDLLNIGLLRPIFSPTDFIQIKGRGTRKHDFIFKERNGGQEIVHKYPKGKHSNCSTSLGTANILKKSLIMMKS